MNANKVASERASDNVQTLIKNTQNTVHMHGAHINSQHHHQNID